MLEGGGMGSGEVGELDGFRSEVGCGVGWRNWVSCLKMVSLYCCQIKSGLPRTFVQLVFETSLDASVSA